MVRLRRDNERAVKVARALYSAFNEDGPGVFGHTTMPEDILPKGMERGSYAHHLSN